MISTRQESPDMQEGQKPVTSSYTSTGMTYALIPIVSSCKWSWLGVRGVKLRMGMYECKEGWSNGMDLELVHTIGGIGQGFPILYAFLRAHLLWSIFFGAQVHARTFCKLCTLAECDLWMLLESFVIRDHYVGVVSPAFQVPLHLIIYWYPVWPRVIWFFPLWFPYFHVILLGL